MTRATALFCSAFRLFRPLSDHVLERADQLPQVWNEMRNKIRDVTPQLPPGVGTPDILDDFSFVYGFVLGSTVDVKNATYTNSIGDALLMAHWKDPEFDPKQRAFYYVRVIEIPKPRWTAYDAKRFGIEMPEEVTMIVTERVYTSPIWYTPTN